MDAERGAERQHRNGAARQPGSGTNSVNLGGGTFTVNQLQFSGTNSGTWNVTNGTIIFDGTNPTFLNQGDSSGLVGSLPSLQLNANTTFEIDSASAVTEVTGAIYWYRSINEDRQRRVSADRDQHLLGRHDDQRRDPADWQRRNEWKHHRKCHRQRNLGL